MLLLLTLATVCHSQGVVSNPVDDFLATPDETWVSIGVLNRGSILRADLDLAGEGKPSVFLAYRAGASKEGLIWTGYVNLGNGNYRRENQIVFRPDTFRVGKLDKFNPSGGLVRFAFGRGGGDIIRYQLGSNGVLTESVLKTIDSESREDQELFETIFGRKIGDPSPSVNFEQPPFKSLLPSVRNDNMTTLASEPKPALQSASSVDLSDVAAAKKAWDLKSRSMTQNWEPSASTPWAIVVVMIAGALVLLCLMLRRRAK